MNIFFRAPRMKRPGGKGIRSNANEAQRKNIFHKLIIGVKYKDKVNNNI